MLSTEQKSIIEQLIQAIRDGSLEEVKKIIEDGGIDINTRYSGPVDERISFDGDTLLHVATYFGRLYIIEYLISKGADLSAKCNSGNTLLVNAIAANQIEAFKFLIARSDDQIINAKNNLGQTLLHMAIWKDHHEFIKELLRTKEVDPNLPDESGTTPFELNLSIATFKNPRVWMESLRLLLVDERTDVNDTDINDKVYKSIFLNNHPHHPIFSVMQEDKHNLLHKVNNILLRKVPSKFLCGEVPQNRRSGWPYIDFIFSFKQELIPQLLKMLSELGRDDVFLKAENVASIKNRINNSTVTDSSSGNPLDYHKAREAIEKYCKRDNATGNYCIVAYFLLPMKDCDKEFQQHFKDIYSVIDSKNFSEIKKDSEDFNKVKESLKLIEENVKKSNIDVNAVNEALTILVREAKFNEHVARLISDYQADITYPEELQVDTTFPESHFKNPDSQNVNLSTDLRK